MLKYLFFISVLLSACKNESHKATPPVFSLPPSVTISAKIDRVFTNDSIRTFVVNVLLKNNTGAEFKYMSMTCSWADAFTSDSKQLSLPVNFCYINWWCEKKIVPFGTDNYIIELHGKKSATENITFRVGYNMTELNSKKDPAALIDSFSNMKNILWSNYLNSSNTIQ